MANSEKRAIGLLVLTAVIILGLVGSLGLSQYYGGVNVSGQAIGSQPTLRNAEQCDRDLQADLDQLWIDHGIPDDEDLSDFTQQQINDFVADYKDVHSDYYICNDEMFPAYVEGMELPDGDLSGGAYDTTVALGMVLHCVSSEEMLVECGFKKPGGTYHKSIGGALRQGGNEKGLGRVIIDCLLD